MAKVDDRFRRGERDAILAQNAQEVREKWPSSFASKREPYYRCEHCQFISGNKSYFAIDHIQPQARGGTTGRENMKALQTAEEQGDVEALYRIGVNYEVLCTGCNSSKRDREFVRDGAGYAYTKPNEDQNPDQHLGG